jgi:predicted nucleotidyltransferase
MRTSAPAILPLFRSEMQLRLLALLLLQPERSWTLQELAADLEAPQSSVHRELARAEKAGLIVRDPTARPHRFTASPDDPMYEPLAALLGRSIGVEAELRSALDRPDVLAAVIYGSWASGNRRPESDIDVLVVADASLRELRRAVRPVGKAAGRTIDLNVLAPDEFQRMQDERSGYLRTVAGGSTIALVGDLTRLTAS